MMPSPPDTRSDPPKISRLRLPSWWLFYTAIGGYGLWRTVHAGGHRVPAFFLMMAVLVMTLPMIVVHELGHFIAGWMMGLKMIEFNLGSGPILWQRTVRGLRLVLRQKPVCGHVTYLEDKQTPRFKRMVCIAGGPGANLLLAVLIMIAWDVRLAAFFSRPSLAAICIVANIWLALLTLYPFLTLGGVAVGSDGWQLWRMIQGKPVKLEAAELTVRRRPNTGLSHLQTAAKSSQDCMQLTALVVVGLLSLVLFLMLIHVGPTQASFYVTVTLVAAAVPAWWVWRQPWTSFAGRAARAAANPHTDQTVAYKHALVSQASDWGLLDLPEEVKLEAVRMSEDPAKLPWLDTILQEWPQARYLQLMKFDVLLADRKYPEAESIMQSILTWENLPEEVRTHFESCRLAARLCAATDEEGHAACDAAISEPMRDGLKMQRLHVFASTAASSNRAELLPKAREWCLHAHAIYPFDPATHTLMGIISVEQGHTTEARSWLLSGADAGGSKSVIPTAWLAILSSIEKHPNAETLLRKSLKQELSFLLKRRVQEALAALPQVTQNVAPREDVPSRS